ncbi:hypothetical protein HQ865_23250 [Mucilaginibacter mali]|uniref:Outer membrane protein beta-barrel domain-containing protein n=1 Tax=Mucilaginibacter mali TaxID=2740462 RepID=A0A7D4TS52_9SPHI|nr:hypothetical protein [Mucilaginibacter mali]QKJ32554.1 hypothetical protein HQ865_23250 [Mucilaginibacter mali]
MKTLIIPSILLVLFCTSCSKHYYAPALYNHDVSYQPKPTSFDKVKSATYVSLGGGFNQAVDDNNSISFAEFNLSEGHVFDHANLSYGAFGFAGAIDNANHENEKSDPLSFASKSFAGVGGRASINMFNVIDNVNFRYFGIEANYSKEFGDFAAYRRAVQGLPDYHVSTRTEMFTLGATSEVIWHARNAVENQYALRLFLGKSLGSYSELKSTNSSDFKLPEFPVYLTVSYFMQIKQLWGAAELTRTDIAVPGLRIRFGYKF